MSYQCLSELDDYKATVYVDTTAVQQGGTSATGWKRNKKHVATQTKPTWVQRYESTPKSTSQKYPARLERAIATWRLSDASRIEAPIAQLSPFESCSPDIKTKVLTSRQCNLISLVYDLRTIFGLENHHNFRLPDCKHYTGSSAKVWVQVQGAGYSWGPTQSVHCYTWD